MKWLAGLLVGLFFMFGATAGFAEDCAKPKSLDDIKGLVTGLGYDVSTEGSLLKITVNSTYNYPVYFSISGDKANLAVFTVLEDLAVDKIARMPAVSILQFNDAHFNYLSLNKRNETLRFVMQNTMPPSAATPQTLRSVITHLIDDSNASDTLWNPAKWN
jgi:hypothetical protein